MGRLDSMRFFGTQYTTEAELREAQMDEIRHRRRSAWRTELGVWITLGVTALGVIVTLLR